MLDTDIEVRKSKIEGRGVFALRDFKPGAVVVEWDTTNTLSDREYEQLPEDQRSYVARFKGGWLYMLEPARYVNHSCDPNAIPLNGADVAIREIRAGDEITSDYRSVMPIGERMECRCGASTCMGYIVGTAV
jgi:SET domain-containing protein